MSESETPRTDRLRETLGLNRCIENGDASVGHVMALLNHAERLESALERAEKAEDQLRSSGFVPCDVPACNCGRWHHRYGLPERWAEIKDDLADAGHPLCNENGNLPRRALAALIAERDDLTRKLAEAERRMEWVRKNIRVLKGAEYSRIMGQHVWGSWDTIDDVIDHWGKNAAAIAKEPK